MSKVLYPKPSPQPLPKKAAHKENPNDLPYHVYYSDPSGELSPEWRHYTSELAVKVGSWYMCKVLGFLRYATLYTREELKQMDQEGRAKVRS